MAYVLPAPWIELGLHTFLLFCYNYHLFFICCLFVSFSIPSRFCWRLSHCWVTQGQPNLWPAAITIFSLTLQFFIATSLTHPSEFSLSDYPMWLFCHFFFLTKKLKHLAWVFLSLFHISKIIYNHFYLFRGKLIFCLPLKGSRWAFNCVAQNGLKLMIFLLPPLEC